MSKHVFISHSHDDAKIACALTNYLVATTSLKISQVLCTSHPNPRARLPLGVNINQSLVKYLTEVYVVIPIVSSISLRRNYVLFEIGGAWALETKIMPVILNKAIVSKLPEVISGLIYTEYNNRSALHNLALAVEGACWYGSPQLKKGHETALANYFDAVK